MALELRVKPPSVAEEDQKLRRARSALPAGMHMLEEVANLTTESAVDEGPELKEGIVLPGRVKVRHFAGHVHHADRLTRPLRVAHLTDQHVGRVTSMKIQQTAVALAMQEKPDVVMLTGDFICHSFDYLDQLEELTSSFDVPVFCVLGNHDHWTGADEDMTTSGNGPAADTGNGSITLAEQ